MIRVHMWSRIWKIEDKNLIKTSVWVSVVCLHRNDQKQTLKPPIRWSFLNSFPFLYQRSEGTGFPTAWHRNFTVLLAGTAWSCFSIFSGITHWGAIANEVNIMITIVCVCTDLCLKEQRASRGLRLTLQFLVACWQFIGQFIFLWRWFIVFFVFRGFNCVGCNTSQMF